MFYQREDFLFSNYSAEPALPMPNKLVSVSSNQNITEQFAAFTEETLHLTDALSLTAGLRYFRTELKTTRSVKASLFQGPVDFTEYLGPAKENGFTPKLAVSA